MSDQQQKQKLQHASKSWSKMGGFGREKYAATWQTQFIFWKIHVTTLKNLVQTSTWFAKHIRSDWVSEWQGNRMIGPGSDINLDRHRVGQPWVDFLCELLTGTLTLTKYAPAGLIWFHFSVKYLYARRLDRSALKCWYGMGFFFGEIYFCLCSSTLHAGFTCLKWHRKRVHSRGGTL